MKKLLTLALAALVGFTACNSGNGAGEKKITIGYVNWAEGVAMTQLAKNILEQKGYTVTLKNADVAPIFAAVAGGDADVFLDTWMPVTHQNYMETFGQKVTVLNTNYEGARIGLVVPDYVAVKSIEELNAAKKKFDGHIVGIDAGAGIMNKAEQAVKDYGLDYQLQSSSEAAMMATLKKSIDEKQPVVITGWAPHWMFARYQLRFLEDPKKVFGETEKIQTIANNEFSVSDTVAVNFFRKFQLNSEQLGSLMGALADADGKEDAAVKDWIGKNQELVKQWD
ncbi:glycine betaine ABC transporter substrate-binding protein [Chitinophaga arvensicola]|uniref:Glycine betaine/proline transport system substrate-binding protein n=1 Tax=Chitinophaga arvensicola TaxID=29529 RepID=A0A1I0RJU3_9BACT|nr:glycine betaine ABC transporter substrate-binding protein [Chitinophaga arvensicola]SEW41273.1 glycine betaine/proline transport system substrate-binding protein [Chitinophaga arvensicola]